MDSYADFFFSPCGFAASEVAGFGVAIGDSANGAGAAVGDVETEIFISTPRLLNKARNNCP